MPTPLAGPLSSFLSSTNCSLASVYDISKRTRVGCSRFHVIREGLMVW